MAMQAHQQLKVVVHYAPAGEPFKDENADRSETVGHLKARLLEHFTLVEGPTSDGNIVTYVLYHEKTPLDNLQQTLGEIAGDRPVLHLKLSKQVTQG
jgi:hypothetical protein